MIERLKALQDNKGQFSNGRELSDSLTNNQDLRNEVRILSKSFFNREVSGCSSCHMDAYIELMKLSIKNLMEKVECQFELKRGKLLRDVVNQDISKNMTQFNITDELALYHLKTNPKAKDFFSVLPENWEEQVEAFDLEELKKGTIKEVVVDLTEAEQALLAEIVESLKAGETKTSLREKYKLAEMVGEKPLTGTLVNILIKKADEIIASEK